MPASMASISCESACATRNLRMFLATNALAFKGVHLLGSQSADHRPIVHGLIVTFTVRKSARLLPSLRTWCGRCHGADCAAFPQLRSVGKGARFAPCPPF